MPYVDNCDDGGCVLDIITTFKYEPVPTDQELQESYIKNLFKWQDPEGFKPVRELEFLPNDPTDETDDEDEVSGSVLSNPQTTPAKVEQEPTFEGVVPAAPESYFVQEVVADGKLYSESLFQSSSDEEGEEDSDSEKENEGDGDLDSDEADNVNVIINVNRDRNDGKNMIYYQSMTKAEVQASAKPTVVKPPSPALAPNRLNGGSSSSNSRVNYNYQTVTKAEVKPPARVPSVSRDSSGPAPVAPIRGPSPPGGGRPSVAELFKIAVAEKAKTDTGKPAMEMQSGGVKPPSPSIAQMEQNGKKLEEAKVPSAAAATKEKPIKNVRTSLTLDELMMECETSMSWDAREKLRKIRKFFELRGFEPKIERVEGKIYGCVATARAKGAGGGLEAFIETEEIFGDTKAEVIEKAVKTLTDLIKTGDY